MQGLGQVFFKLILRGEYTEKRFGKCQYSRINCHKVPFNMLSVERLNNVTQNSFKRIAPRSVHFFVPFITMVLE